MTSRRPDVRAAGGVVVRRKQGRDEVAVVHRPRYDDWSLPKGKLLPGEDWEETALREVEEETGQRCEIDAEVAPVRYVDNKGRRKLVRYWRMRRRSGRFKAGEEVDRLRWLEPRAARRLLSYARDREVLDSAFPRSGSTRGATRGRGANATRPAGRAASGSGGAAGRAGG